MTISLKHSFQSQKSDGSDSTEVQPSNWNAEHTLTCASNKVLGRATAGTGAVEEIACTALGRSLISAASSADIVGLLDLTAQISTAFPPGMIMPFGAATPPTGWLVCNGSAVSRTTYAALFSVIGTTWGAGDSTSTFNVPDLRGVFLRGVDGGRGYDDNRALGSYQDDGYPSHTHTLTDNGHTHTYTAGGAATGIVAAGFNQAVQLSAPASGTNSSSATTGITINSGGGTASEVRPKNVAVVYCIRT